MIVLRLIDTARSYVDGPDLFPGIPQNDIIDFIVSKHIDQLNTIEELNKFMNILKSVIERMIKTMSMLIITEENDNVDLRVIKLNPVFSAPFE